MVASSTFRCWATSFGGVCVSQSDRENSGPLGSLVPMQLPNAAGGQTHVDAGYFLRDCKIIDRDLPRSASILDALGSVVERRPGRWHAADIGCGR
jgi:hypothetical protein